MAKSVEKTQELLNKIITEEFGNCPCEDCRGLAWDRVIEIEGR
jgi:hypothetical protein